VEDEEEEEQGGGEAAGEQDISTNIRTHEQALHCISEVLQFALIQTLPAFLNYCIQLRTALKKTNTKKWKQVSLLDLWKKSQRAVYWKHVIRSVMEH
jgi:hypothetical protein